MSGQRAIALPISTPVDGRSERLAALFDAHDERLYRLARRLAPGADEARDLVQETFLRAAESWRAVPVGAAREESWLVRVLINIRRDQWRKTAVRRRSDAMLRVTLTADSSNLESALMAKRAIWGALDVLPPRRRAIVVMHELDGMSLSRVASFLGLREITVRWHLSMARRDLKRLLTSHTGEIG